ncbi:MAG: NAD(P)-dependent oxidoreductase [Eubacterium sp.]|nr:NAD(P)-dependent oxidoreductase [Candidatus Colimonas fimequi]
MKTVGFIGVGIMGKSMVRNLMKNGFEVHIFARTRAKVEEVISEDAIFHETIAECAADRDVVITCVGYPSDVEDVYFGDDRIIANAKKGALLIDMSTTDPSLEERIAAAAEDVGLRFLDAPVTGGDRGAKAGTLSILVGGNDKSDFDDAMDLFEAMGKNITYYGKAGCGQHAKLANQIMQGSIMSAICEGLSYAKAMGLDLDVFMTGAKGGAGQNALLESYGPRIKTGDFAPGFFIDFFIKDMGLGYNAAKESGLELSSLKLAMDHYKELSEAGHGLDGMQYLINYYKWD